MAEKFGDSPGEFLRKKVELCAVLRSVLPHGGHGIVLRQ